MKKRVLGVVGLICCLGIALAYPAKIGTRVTETKKAAVVTCPADSSDGAQFVYKGTAKTVCVAGSFNNWNAERDALSETSQGVWTIVLPLSAKQYQYKFVVDGNWMLDPENSKTADDGYGGKNSVIDVAPRASAKEEAQAGPAEGKQGTKFTYKGAATTVFISGSFNDWSATKNALREVKPGVWEAVMPLIAGQYQYKFVVDGKWVLDASNPKTADDGFGGKNSSISVEKGLADVKAKGPSENKEGIKFSIKAPNASSVFLTGEFNKWSTNSDCMTMDDNGIWSITKKLQNGRYQYKFVVDGNWTLDPENKRTAEDGYGGKNSVVAVNETVEIAMPGGPQITKDGVRFTYFEPGVSSVFLAGNFNNWSAGQDIMNKDGSGMFSIIKKLPKGKYIYKYVIDGTWRQDPGNKEVADDGLGGKNSVLEVK